jgi:4-amino-4-deoxy-L-arabinose transferase-like glycosyltransferase
MTGVPAKTVTGDGGVSLWTSIRADDDGRVTWQWLMLLAMAALLLRTIGLNSGLWYDEILALIESIRSPFSSIITEFPSNNQHTLFSLLAHLSIQLFGEHPWAVRLPSLIFGVAAVPVLYLFAREFVTRTEALLALVLLTTAYHPVWFSQNARGYSTLAFFTLLCSWLLLRGLRRGRVIDAVWYGLAGALGAYTHLTMIFLVASHALLCGAAVLRQPGEDLFRRRGRFAVLAFALAAVFTLVLYAPMLLEVKQFFVEHPNRTTPATPGWAVGELIRGLQVGLGASVGAIVAAVFFAAGLRSYFKQSPFITGVFVLPGIVTVAAALALGRPIFPRFVFFLIGFALLIAVRGALVIGDWLERHSPIGPLVHWSITPSVPGPIGPLLVAAMAAASLVALVPNYRYPKQDFEGALKFAETHRAPNEAIVTAGLTRRVYREFYHRPFPNVATLEEFQKIRAEGQPVWVLFTLERYINARSPELMRALRSDCVIEAVFRGTVGQGDVTVCRTHPIE